MSDADDKFFGACPVCGKKGGRMTRALLPHRRASATFKLRFGDQRGAYHVTCGYYDDGRLGEVFVSTNKIGSQADAIARDGAILLSLALQHGVELKVIRGALTREGNGEASTIIGAVVDRLSGELKGALAESEEAREQAETELQDLRDGLKKLLAEDR
jgi:hypothetical protein